MPSNALPPLSLKRGTTSSLSITIPDDVDPSGATVFFTVKPIEVTTSQNDSDSYAIFKKEITDRTGRVFTTDIDPEDTDDAKPGAYVYGITVKDATGQILGTKANGPFVISPRDTADTDSD